MYERLDRGFGNLEWRLKFPEMAVKVVLRVKFDHHPVLVELHYKESKNKTIMSFINEAVWVTHQHFTEFFQKNWNDQVDLQSFSRDLLSTQRLSLEGKEIIQGL